MSRPQKNTSGKKMAIYQILVNIKDPMKDSYTELTTDILVLPPDMSKEGLSKYPYMVEHRRIPSDKLFGMLRIGYDTVIQFFFNKTMFMKTMGPDSPDIQESRSDILEDNVKLMLALIFPTTYPVPRNNFNSFGHYITRKDTSIYVKGQLSDSILGTPLYTYIQLGGSKYTVTRTVWLNDIYNNPVYRKLINEYSVFAIWLSEAKPRVVIEIRTLINTILKSSAWSTLFLPVTDADAEFNAFDAIIKDKDINAKFQNIKIADKTEIKNVFLQQILNILVSDLNTYKKLMGSINSNDYIERIGYLYDMFKAIQIVTEAKEKAVAVINGNKYTPEEITKIEDKGDDTSNSFIKQPEIISILIALFELNQVYGKILQTSSKTIFKPELTELMKIISNNLVKITLARKVYEAYLLPKKYIIEETDDSIITELNKNYSTLVNYGKRVQNLKQYVSTNSELQQAVNEYINAEENNKFDAILEGIQTAIDTNTLFKDVVSDKKLLNTGVGRINPNNKDIPQYEIYVGMDLIKGALKRDDVKKIKCSYEGFFLGQQLSLWSVASNNIDYIVVDLEELLKKSKQKEQQRSKMSRSTQRQQSTSARKTSRTG
jgi:hypothetical protein